MMSSLFLAVFAKDPVPGQVKTRMALPPELTARLYAAFVQDTLQKASRLGLPVTVYHSGDAAALKEMALPTVTWQPQGEGDLGERLARVPAPCIILGTDSPHLPMAILNAAVRAVGESNVVLGPAEDGGYFLAGLPAPCPPLFQKIAWSTDQVLSQTLAQAHSHGIPVVLTAPWYDLDTLDDLRRLAAHLRRVSPGSGEDCPATRAALREWKFFDHARTF